MKLFSLANCFSLIRGFAGIAIIAVFLFPTLFPYLVPSYFQLLVFTSLIWITDYLDGLSARKGWLGSEVTQFGAKIDPLADKALMFACMLVVVLILPDWYLGVFLVLVFFEGFVNIFLQKNIMKYNQNKVLVLSSSKKITWIQAIIAGCLFLLLAWSTERGIAVTSEIIQYLMMAGFWIIFISSFFRIGCYVSFLLMAMSCQTEE